MPVPEHCNRRIRQGQAVDFTTIEGIEGGGNIGKRTDQVLRDAGTKETLALDSAVHNGYFKRFVAKEILIGADVHEPPFWCKKAGFADIECGGRKCHCPCALRCDKHAGRDHIDSFGLQCRGQGSELHQLPLKAVDTEAFHHDTEFFRAFTGNVAFRINIRIRPLLGESHAHILVGQVRRAVPHQERDDPDCSSQEQDSQERVQSPSSKRGWMLI